MRSQTRPTSVHQLRPGDIDVIGAIGDSLTAGNGMAATHLLQLHTENRGLSWCIGKTLIIKFHNNVSDVEYILLYFFFL